MGLIHLMSPVILIKDVRNDDLWHATDSAGCGGSGAPVMDHRCHMGEKL